MADDQSPKNTIDELIKDLTKEQSSQPSSQGASNIPPRPPMPPPFSRPAQSSPPTPPSVVPPRPPVAPSFSPSNPVTPTAPSTPPRPAPSQSSPGSFQSSIRTMASDLNRIKTGAAPEGITVQKNIESPQPRPAIQPPAPSAIAREPIRSSVNIPPATPPKPAPDMSPASGQPPFKTFTPPHATEKKPEIVIPPPSRERSIGGLSIALILVVLLLAGGAYWYFLIRDDSPTVVISPTPFPEESPIDTNILNAIFATPVASISFDALSFSQDLNNIPLSSREFTRLIGDTKGAGDSGVKDLLDRFLVPYPAQIQPLISGDSAVLVYGQTELFNTEGQLSPADTPSTRLVLITRAFDADSEESVKAAMTSWETSIISDLEELMGIDESKNFQGTFSETIYRESRVVYKNFPYPDRSIDYAVVNSGSNVYVIITNSRESIFAAIDRILDFSSQ